MVEGTGLRGLIAAANRHFMIVFTHQDAAALSTLYTQNGQLLPPGADFVTGRPAIQAVWQSVIDMGIKTATLETVELDPQGDAAIEVGKYTFGGDSGKVMDTGKYLAVWKREAGQWKLHRDIWNTSVTIHR